MTTDQKRAKFIELAQKRTNKALVAVRRLSYLANRSNYLFSQDDADKIANTIIGEVQAVRQKMAGGKPADVNFTL